MSLSSRTLEQCWTLYFDAAANPSHRADSLRQRRLGFHFILGQACAASASRSCHSLGISQASGGEQLNMPFASATNVARPPILVMPVGFDLSLYNDINARAALVANPNDATASWKRNAWFGYSAAWNGLAYRWRSAVEYGEKFERLIALGTAPPREEHYAQERALFGCVAAALSSIECFYMAAYCVGNGLVPNDFPLLSAKHLTKDPAQISKAYFTWAPSDTFTLSLVRIADSVELKSLADLRNSLAHRGILPRQHSFSTTVSVPSAVPSNPKALAADFSYDAILDQTTTSSHTAWLCQVSCQLMLEFRDFLGRHG